MHRWFHEEPFHSTEGSVDSKYVLFFRTVHWKVLFGTQSGSSMENPLFLRDQIWGVILRLGSVPALLGLWRQFWPTIPEWMDAAVRLLRSTTEGVGGAEGGCCCCCRGCWEGWLCSLPGLAGILFSNRNSSKSIYSSWKLSPSYGRVLSHSVGPKKADWGVLRAFPSSSNFFSFSFSFPNPEGTRWRRYCHCPGKKIKFLSSFMHICVVLHADFNENITVFKSIVSLEMCLIDIILKIFLIFFMQNIIYYTFVLSQTCIYADFNSLLLLFYFFLL